MGKDKAYQNSLQSAALVHIDESGVQPQQSGKVSDMTRYLLKEVRQGQLLQIYQTHSIKNSLTNQPV